jgi:hypothetical protein
VLDVLYVFCRGADNNLYKTQRTGYDDWLPWQRITSDGSVRGRISVALTAAAGVQHAHVIYAASSSKVRYQRFAADWSPAGSPEEWSSALEGVIASDGSHELLAVIRKSSGQMLTQHTTRPWGGAWQSVATLPSSCLDISNVVFFGGAFHVAYVMKTLRDDISGTYAYFLAHTRYRAGMYDDGYFRVLLEYQPQGNVQPQATLAIYRNKLIAAYIDEQSNVRYAYWDTADPRTPWVGMEVVASGKSRNRPALAWLNVRAYLTNDDFMKANFGNDLFAAVRGLTADRLWVINFSRAFFAQRIEQIGLAVDWCTNYSGPKVMKDCVKITNLPPITEIPAFTEVGFGTITLPDWLMSLIFRRVMKYEGNPSGRYYTWIHTKQTGPYFGPHLNIDYLMDYLSWHEEIGHRLATNLALWDEGAKHVNPHLMSDLFPYPITNEAAKLFGQWTTYKSSPCKGGADTNGRCRGFTGIAGNYDVNSLQHSWIYIIYFYMKDADQLRKMAYEDIRAGIDLLKRKYEWIRKYIFRGVEFNKDNEPLLVVKIVNKHSGKVLDVVDWIMDNHASIQQYKFHGGDNQCWAMMPDGEGYYQLVAMHSGKCLDVAGVSQENGAKVQLYDCHGGNNQKWKLIPDGDGYFEIVAKHSGKCLDVTAWSTNDRADIQQYARHGGANQKWKFEYVVTF